MTRYDDAFRGPAPIDAIQINECYARIAETSPAWPMPAKIPVAAMEFFTRTYPTDQKQAALQRHFMEEGIIAAMIAAITAGELPIWVAPIDGSEKLVAPGAFIELGRETILAGCYRPYNDRSWLVGRPLFAKRRAWEEFEGKLIGRIGEEVERASKPRKKPGPRANPMWEIAVAIVTEQCVAAGMARPTKRGDKAKVARMLLEEMAKNDDYYTDDTAAKYADRVIARLPER